MPKAPYLTSKELSSFSLNSCGYEAHHPICMLRNLPRFTLGRRASTGPITVVMSEIKSRIRPFHRLQWVHGPITVVMTLGDLGIPWQQVLQWVHGPITVVMPRRRK